MEVVFGAGADGRRSSAAAGPAIVAAALRPVDPAGAAATERAKDRRKDHVPHFRRLVGAGLPTAADWLTIAGSGPAGLAGRSGRLVLGNYAYAHGGLHVRISAAADLLARRLVAVRPDTALAFLATPTDVFAVPAAAVDAAVDGYARRGPTRRLLGAATGHRLAQRPYAPGADPGVNDSLVPVQGPNYALAKRIQRWRAAVARAGGTTVSFHVAPSSRTRSVLSSRPLRAAFDGAHHVGVEVFEPATASTLLAALLVHDLHTAPAPRPHPWQDEAEAAVHGGLWRTPFTPRSVLGVAAVRGALHV